jgi:hypothetical protein
MKILKNMELIGKSLFLIKEKILIISDLHIGFEQIALDSGFFIPKTQHEDMKKTLEDILKKVKPEKIIILGDLKHDFGRINKQEWKETESFLNFLKKNVKDIVLIKGNHDNMLEPLVKKHKIKILDYYIEKKIAFFHGHKIWNKLYDKKIKIWIVGHKHPAIIIKKHAKQEKYKCFLKGKYKDKQMIIMPSFFPLTEGSDIFLFPKNFDKFLGSQKSKNFLDDTHFSFKLNESNFEVYIIDDKGGVYDFGKVKDIKRMK